MPVEPPRGKTPSRNDTAQPKKFPDPQARPAQREGAVRTEPPLPEPRRPQQVRAPGWTDSGRMDDQQRSAQENAKWRNAQLAQRPTDKSPIPTDKAAIRADIQRAQGKPSEQAQAREPVAAAENAAPKTKAGIKADLYKAMQSESKPFGPSRGGGRGR